MRNITLALCLVVLAVPAAATQIGIYDSPAAGSCSLNRFESDHLVSVYIIETQSTGSTGASFRVDADLPGLMTDIGWSWLDGICVGDCNPYEGASVERACSTEDWVMCRLDFLSDLVTREPSCNHLRIVGFPSDDVLVYDCNDQGLSVTGGHFSFTDGMTVCDDCSSPLPTHATTWGALKALYR
jgi:hypothetical protein